MEKKQFFFLLPLFSNYLFPNLGLWVDVDPALAEKKQFSLLLPLFSSYLFPNLGEEIGHILIATQPAVDDSILTKDLDIISGVIEAIHTVCVPCKVGISVAIAFIGLLECNEVQEQRIGGLFYFQRRNLNHSILELYVLEVISIPWLKLDA